MKNLKARIKSRPSFAIWNSVISGSLGEIEVRARGNLVTRRFWSCSPTGKSSWNGASFKGSQEIYFYGWREIAGSGILTYRPRSGAFVLEGDFMVALVSIPQRKSVVIELEGKKIEVEGDKYSKWVFDTSDLDLQIEDLTLLMEYLCLIRFAADLIWD